MWRTLFTQVALALSVTHGVFANDAQNMFIYPPTPSYLPNEVWRKGSTQHIQFETTISKYYIMLYQQNDTGHANPVLQVYKSPDNGDGSGQQQFDWVVTNGTSDLSISPFYYLWLSDFNKFLISSHFFNITEEPLIEATTSSTSSTATLSSSTPSPTPSTTSTLSTTSIATTTSSAPASTTIPPTPTTSDKDKVKTIGLGVGLGVGITLALLGGIWTTMIIVRRRKSPGAPESVQSNQSSHPLHDLSQREPAELYAGKPQYQSYKPPGLYEKPGSEPQFAGPHELPHP
ncbi:hypothetical protein LTR56_000876 [Elasticomyces elasticus]|nr:hypothetical protein LTR56_000876 [Elasticomyces elasticus]KAK3665450.1 hypothetical protein LTR22_003680 [Elasticomyces elasticus]KAK4929907.1 hypothetical protein LTR49_003534 [Elasticomyces elasticus]KAK5769283.1 hypothetical protein LTS12_000634 [Elasticomyces elasticus]